MKKQVCSAVYNLRTGEVREYTLPPRHAVVAAYAQAHGDFNTWEYAKYKDLVEEGRYSYCIGDWAVLKGKE